MKKEIIDISKIRKERQDTVLNNCRIYKAPFCMHREKNIDRETRVVWCIECEIELDTFGVLEGIVNENERNINNRNFLINETNDMEIALKAKRNELRSLNGKINRRKVNISKQ